MWNHCRFNSCEKCVLSNDTKGRASAKTQTTKLYVSVVTLSIQDNAKLLQQLKSDFRRTISSNKYKPNVSI